MSSWTLELAHGRILKQVQSSLTSELPELTEMLCCVLRADLPHMASVVFGWVCFEIHYAMLYYHTQGGAGLTNKAEGGSLSSHSRVGRELAGPGLAGGCPPAPWSHLGSWVAPVPLPAQPLSLLLHHLHCHLADAEMKLACLTSA